MFYTIYKITNTINGKTYIGKHQTSNLQDGYMGSGKLLKRAIRKYGLDKFTKEILHVFDNEADMDAKEKELVTEEYCNQEDTYNICEGGQGGWSYINRIGLNDAKKHGALGGAAFAKRLKQDISFSENHSKRMTKTLIEQHKEGKRPSITDYIESARIANIGSFWTTNGFENKRMKKNSIIPEGWYKGRTLNKH